MAWDESKRFSLVTDPTRVDADLANFPAKLRINSSCTEDSADLTALFDDLKIAVNDDFTGANGSSPNSDRWATCLGTPTINENMLRFDLSSSNLEESVVSTWKLRNDFDIQIDLTVVTGPSTNTWLFGLDLLFDDKYYYTMTRRYSDSVHKYQAWYYDNSSWYSIGSQNSTDTTCKFRITRSSNTITCYYWTGSAWSAGWSRNHGSAPDCTVRLTGSTQTGNPTATGDFDNFVVNSGTILQYKNRTKIAVYHGGDQSTGTQCPVEVVRFEPHQDEALFYVKLPTVDAETAEQVVVYYDVDHSDISTTDDFTGSNGDEPNNSRWTRLASTPDIQNNKLNLQVSSSVTSEIVCSNWEICGDFDVQMDYDLTTYPGTNYWGITLAAYMQDGIKCTLSRRYHDGQKYYFDWWNGSSWSFSASANTSDTSGKLRLTRIGNVFHGYYWNGSSWVELGSGISIGGSVARVFNARFAIEGWSAASGYPTAEMNADNFVINSGNVIHGADTKIALTGYRPSHDVWDANFKCVYHMAQNPARSLGYTTGPIRESTTSQKHGTPYNLEDSDLVAEGYGPSIAFDGSNEYVDFNYSPVSGANSRTLEAWFKYENDMGTLINWGGTSNGTIFGLIPNDTSAPGKMLYWTWGSGYDLPGTISLVNGTWYYTTMTFDGTTLTGKLNLVDDASASRTLNTASTANLRLAQAINSGYFLDCTIGEIRVSSVVRSAAWLKATYHSIIDSFWKVNQQPSTPSITDTDPGQTDVDLTGSSFSDSDGDSHAASQWQIDLEAEDFSTPVYDSGEDTTNKTTINITGLSPLTDYKARVRYKDDSGAANAWSEWSSAELFSTLVSNISPDTPTITAGTIGATSVVLTGSAFSDDDPGDTHHASQWQVDVTAGNFSTPVYDSGEDHTNLTSKTVTGLTRYTGYKARVRYKDSSGAANEWSGWSTAVSFTTLNTKPNKPSMWKITDYCGTAFTLWSNAFSDADAVDTHTASQWQVDFIGADFSTPFYDSGSNDSMLTTCPVYNLVPDWAYKVRVRHKDSSGDSSSEWSDWSDVMTFNDSEWRSRMGAQLSTLRKYVRREIGDPAPERKLSALSLVHDGAANSTTYFQDASHNFITLGIEIGDVIYNVTDGGSISVIRAIGSGSGTNDKLYVDSIDAGTDNDFDVSDAVYIYDRHARKHLDGTRISDTDVLDAINQAQKLVAIRFGGIEKTRIHEDIAVHDKVDLVSVSGTFVSGETVTGGTYGHIAVVEYASATVLVLSQMKTRIDFDGSAGTFLVGEEVTFGTSGATGRVETVGADYLMVSDLDDDPVNDETITGGTSGATALVNEASAYSPRVFSVNETLTGGTSSATGKVRDTYTSNNINVGQGVPTDLKSLKVAKYWDGTQWNDLPIFHIMEVMRHGKATGDPLAIAKWNERLWLWPNESGRRVDALHLLYSAWGTDLSADTDEIDFGPQYERITVLEAAKIITGNIEDNKRWERICKEIEGLNFDVMACDVGDPGRVNQEQSWGSEDSFI